jgi:hypothetical protein
VKNIYLANSVCERSEGFRHAEAPRILGCAAALLAAKLGVLDQLLVLLSVLEVITFIHEKTQMRVMLLVGAVAVVSHLLISHMLGLPFFLCALWLRCYACPMQTRLVDFLVEH